MEMAAHDHKSEAESGSNAIEIDRQAQSVTFHRGVQNSQHYGPGDTIGDSYLLEELIGRGGMGVVFRARHTIMEQHYAVKLLAPRQINDQSWRRFEVEGRALTRLKHDNIVTIHNMGVDRGQFPFFVMDWLPGISLADHISQSGALSESETLSLFVQVCAGLGSAHKNGIIHRDIKPANLMLVPTAQGLQVKIVDFGMARLNSQQALTAAGEIFGSPLHMSPEQCLGEAMDARSDIYSLGCSFFECLTGKPPFKGDSALNTLLMHQEKIPPSLKEVKPDTEFSAGLEAMVAKCMRKGPEQRYQSVDHLAQDLQRLTSGKPVGSPKETDDLHNWKLFADDSQSFNSNTESSIHSSNLSLFNNRGWQITLAAFVLLLICGSTYAWIKQNRPLPKVDLKMATELNDGHSTGNISTDIYQNPGQVVADLKKMAHCFAGKNKGQWQVATLFCFTAKNSNRFNLEH